MSEYNRLAWFYNKYWTSFAPELFYEVLEDFFLPQLPDKAAILDLCCGTGQVSAMLADNGYIVTGVDISDGMLAMARSNAPTAEFIKADARNVDLGRQFDLIVSFFDSMNHMMELADLEMCFRAAYKMLKPGASFIFDLNSEESFNQLWENSFSMVEDDNACILKAIYEEQSKIASYLITTFRLDGDCEHSEPAGNSWRREDMAVYERCYSPKEVVELLGKCGFSNIRVLHGEDELEIEAFEGRIFFVAS